MQLWISSWYRINSPYLLPFIIVGLFSIFVKSIFLQSGSGLLVVSRFIGLQGIAQLSMREHVDLLVTDMMLGLVLVPIMMTLLLAIFVKRRYFSACLVVSSLLYTVLFIGFLSFSNTGRFISVELILDALWWSVDHPQDIMDIATPSAIVKALLILMVISAGCVVAKLALSSQKIHRMLSMLSGFIISITILTFSFSMMTPSLVSSFPQSTPIAYIIISSLFDLEGSSERYNNLNQQQILQSMSLIDDGDNDLSEHAKIKQHKDVILFILETGPYASFKLNGGLKTLPYISSLAQSAYVAKQHHSTYPYTSSALFSIISGLYPVHARKAIIDVASTKIGLFHTLSANGYHNALYLPQQDSFKSDVVMFDKLGISSRFISKQHEIEPAQETQLAKIIDAIVPAGDTQTLRAKLRLDLMVIEQVKRDIVKFKRNKQRFSATILPQIGHGRWPNIYAAESIKLRGRHLIELQDKWLGDIVELLKANDWLKDTIIVVTSDHGIRTKSSDPDFQFGTVNDYSFHVPLVIYQEQLNSTVEIDTITSHIDLAPTLLDLMAIPAPIPQMQGLPIYHQGIKNRRTFFFAGNYLGADGYYYQGKYHMYSKVSDACYQHSSLNFSAETMVPCQSSGIKGVIVDAQLLQHQFTKGLDHGGLMAADYSR